MKPRSWMASDLRVNSARVLSTLIDNLDGMMFRFRLDPSWTLMFASGGCLALTGYAPEALVLNRDLSYESLTLIEDRQRVRSHILDAT